MLCIKLLLSFIAFLTVSHESNKSLAMSFTAHYDDLNRNKVTTPSPIQVGVFTAAASIQINQPKPKHIENLQTILLNITIFATSISLEWKFWVVTKTRLKRSKNANVMPEKRLLEWVIKVRQFGTLNVNIYHVTDEDNSIDDILVHNKTYNYTIKGLEPFTAYELCIHSKHHTISDNIYTVINSKQSITQSNRNYDICKEIVTLSSDSNNVSDIAMASAISSASTTIVIVVMFCCCRRGSKRDANTKRQHKHRRSIKYQRIWKWLDKSPQRSPQRSSLSTSSNGTNIKQFHLNHAIIPVVNHSEDFVTYIDPNDIKCITGKKVRIFSRIPKPLTNYMPQMRNNISTTSKFKIRYGRPNSWPQMDSNKVYNKSNSNPSLSQNNKLWFRSMSSGVKLNNSISNVDFV